MESVISWSSLSFIKLTKKHHFSMNQVVIGRNFFTKNQLNTSLST